VRLTVLPPFSLYSPASEADSEAVRPQGVGGRPAGRFPGFNQPSLFDVSLQELPLLFPEVHHKQRTTPYCAYCTVHVSRLWPLLRVSVLCPSTSMSMPMSMSVPMSPPFDPCTGEAAARGSGGAVRVCGLLSCGGAGVCRGHGLAALPPLPGAAGGDWGKGGAGEAHGGDKEGGQDQGKAWADTGYEGGKPSEVDQNIPSLP